jgi:hypothetical protein
MVVSLAASIKFCPLEKYAISNNFRKLIWPFTSA